LMPKYVWLNPQTGQDEYVTIDAIKDQRVIFIYEDHLARDTANFLQGNSCSPIELPGGLVTSITGFVCKAAAAHAFNGTSDEPWRGWDVFPNEGAYPTNGKHAERDTQITALQRGDIVSYGASTSATGHWETYLGNGITYAADAVGGKFLRDAPLDYPRRNHDYGLLYMKIWKRPVTPPPQ
ncbi:MAG TPA: hypothetical protein PL033_20395, partial [Candidatus Brocadiia bacterium]|nr:hypothetical protein [Candidatus Brocadiia bacterium]